MRTLSLYCDELIDERKILEAEQLLKSSLEELSKEEIDADFLAKTYFTLVRCLLEMKRNEEALMYMQKQRSTVRAQCLINGATFICIQVNGRKRKNNLLLACG